MPRSSIDSGKKPYPESIMRLNRPLAILSSLAVVTATSGAAQAHHGWSSYDATKTLTITAPIDELKYENPHGLIWITHEGKRTEVYLAPPARMVARGLQPDALIVGKAVTVEAYANTADPAELRAERITVDGKVIELR
jgi:hypothetical protein